MESESEIIQLELKYCERCGGLWLRRKGHVEVFCAACQASMPERAVMKRPPTRPRLPIHRGPEIQGRAEGFALLQGGRA